MCIQCVDFPHIHWDTYIQTGVFLKHTGRSIRKDLFYKLPYSYLVHNDPYLCSRSPPYIQLLQQLDQDKKRIKLRLVFYGFIFIIFIERNNKWAKVRCLDIFQSMSCQKEINFCHVWEIKCWWGSQDEGRSKGESIREKVVKKRNKQGKELLSSGRIYILKEWLYAKFTATFKY